MVGDEEDESGRKSYRYDAFLSYRHVEPDRQCAKWLHRALETYRVPKSLVETGLPPRIGRVFRDEEELPASPNLSHSIQDALEDSQFLIVVCSPRIKESIWCDAEVQKFRDLGRHDKIIALLIEGEPADSFLPSLCEIRTELIQSDGTKIDHIESIEPLAADIRPSRTESQRELKSLAKLRILACILGCRFDDLRQREQIRKQKRMATLGVLLGVLVLTFLTLAAWAFQERNRAEDARDRTQEALDRNMVESSRVLFENGRRLLDEGLVEEGLAVLVRSLRVWPSNGYARDRLLYELHYRSWLTPEEEREIVPLPISDGEESRRYSIAKDGSLAMSCVQGATAPDETLFHLKAEKWVSQNGMGQPSGGMNDPFDNGTLRVANEDYEGRKGFSKVTLKVPTKTVELFGIGTVNEELNMVAVAGFLDEGAEGYGDDRGLVYVTWFDATTLELKGEVFFARPKDSDVKRLAWDESVIYLISKGDNREFYHVDAVNSSDSQVILHDAILPASELSSSVRYDLTYEADFPESGTLWCFANGKITLFDFAETSQEEGAIMKRTYVLSGTPKLFSTSGGISRHNPDTHDEADQIQSYCEATGHRAVLKRGGIYISDQDGQVIHRIRPFVLAGEGGRQLQDLIYSPAGRYLLVRGLSVGGGVDDWEVHNNHGVQVFPICLPRSSQHLIGIPHVVIRHGYFTAVRGWSEDGKFLIFAGAVSGYRGKVTAKPDQNLQLVFCTDPTPPWFLAEVDQILKVRFLANGEFVPVFKIQHAEVRRGASTEYTYFLKSLRDRN